MGKPAPTVVVASDDPVLLDEVVRHLEEVPSWRLAGWASTASGLLRLLAEHRPEAALVSAGVALQLERAPESTRLVVVAAEQEARILRCSLRLGATFVLWPQERGDLRAAVEDGIPEAETAGARLVAVWGPKGGSGASVLAAHLAGAAASASLRCTLVDLDLWAGDQRALLGIADHEADLADLLEAGDDVTPEAAGGVTWRHPAGFGVVPAPRPEAGPPSPDHRALGPALDAIREQPGLVLADLASGLWPHPVGIAAGSDAVAMVVTPDLLSLRRSRDAVAAVAAAAGSRGPEVGAVLNRWDRATGLSGGDVEAVLGVSVWAKVALQPGLLRAPDLGRLSRPACRALAPLASRLALPSAGADPRTAAAAGAR